MLGPKCVLSRSHAQTSIEMAELQIYMNMPVTIGYCTNICMKGNCSAGSAEQFSFIQMLVQYPTFIQILVQYSTFIQMLVHPLMSTNAVHERVYLLKRVSTYYWLSTNICRRTNGISDFKLKQPHTITPTPSVGKDTCWEEESMTLCVCTTLKFRHQLDTIRGTSCETTLCFSHKGSSVLVTVPQQVDSSTWVIKKTRVNGQLLRLISWREHWIIWTLILAMLICLYRL